MNRAVTKGVPRLVAVALPVALAAVCGAAIAASPSITATKDYVDRKDAAITNQLVRVEANVATNLAAKADAVTVVAGAQGAVTNRVVYAQGARLVIKADVAPDGVRRWRLVEE